MSSSARHNIIFGSGISSLSQLGVPDNTSPMQIILIMDEITYICEELFFCINLKCQELM